MKSEVRRIPIDFRAIAAESGLRRGKLCFSDIFGWGVQNTHGDEGPSFGCITPPAIEEGQTLRIENEREWVIEEEK